MHTRFSHLLAAALVSLSACASSQPTAAGTAEPHTTSVHIERSSVAPDTSPEISDSDFASFIAHNNKFGLDLGQAQLKANGYTDRNALFSPLSASFALGMTYAGARTETAREMKVVLGDTFGDATYHIAANRLLRELRARATSRTDAMGKAHTVELNLVDSIFTQSTLGLEAPFLDVLGREYDSGVRQVDFSGAPESARMLINDWVADETKDKILDLLPPGSIDPSTLIVLVNALYFYGSWQHPFMHEFTHDAAFQTLASTSVQVPTMRLRSAFDYASREQFTLAELPYEGDGLRMTIVLPAAGMFEQVRSQVSSAWLQEAVTGLKQVELDVALPKFKLTVGSFSLETALEALGMRAAFSGDADFSGISQEAHMHISDVLQKTFISVDEDGTEAAAATAVVLTKGDAVDVSTPTQFIVDRPFLFFIRDKNGCVLFSGQVVDPSQH